MGSSFRRSGALDRFDVLVFILDGDLGEVRFYIIERIMREYDRIKVRACGG